ncbi:hypothetical protein JZ751_028045 [Albula glossodonta]|uniref:Uncharacterized protein n=1 Tax=Albula glossodonta TaxID=121402 RepID=A0A8T2PKS5_9TELE|nr:hypothetical protein JZ751_028045 [Albula glossodonta]
MDVSVLWLNFLPHWTPMYHVILGQSGPKSVHEPETQKGCMPEQCWNNLDTRGRPKPLNL